MLDLSSLEISGESLTTFAIFKKWEMQKVKNFSPVSDNCLVEADELNTTVIFLLIECPRIYSTNQEPEPPKSRNSAWLLALVLALALSCSCVLQSLEILQLCLSWYISGVISCCPEPENLLNRKTLPGSCHSLLFLFLSCSLLKSCNSASLDIWCNFM